MGIIIQLLISMTFSAFFSGMEIAFVSSNKLRFEMGRNNSLPTRILSVFYHNPNNFISTMLVGNNIALVIYGILMAQLIEHYVLGGLITNEAALVVIETLVSTGVILITGEFMPKTLFKINPNFTLRLFAIPAFICYVLLYPISRFSTFLSTCILRITGIRINKEESEKAFTKVDLDYFIQSSIDESADEKEIDPEIKIFQNALDFSNVKIRDCMVPRTEIIAVDMTASISELKAAFIASGVSKVIVYNESIDNIIGYVHSSDLFRSLTDWHKSIRPIPIVPETMGGHKLMQLFLQKKRSLAVVVDEFGGTSGVVSMEDLVEEILGDIEDEHDTNSTVAKAIGIMNMYSRAASK